MDLDETEARNGCAGEAQQQFNWSTEQLVCGKSLLASKAMNTEAEGSTAMEAVIRQLVKTQQTEKTYCVL
jgi:hypothetical protein